MMDNRINSAAYVVVLSEPMNFPLTLALVRKWEIERGKDKLFYPTQRTFVALSATRPDGSKPVVGDYRGNCSNVNVRGTMNQIYTCTE